jgi:hypothetical protein
MTISSLLNSSAVSQLAAYNTSTRSSQTSQTSSSQQDSSQISDFGKLMQQLESLQESDPTKFKETASTIADKLEAAAKDAANSGDTQQASALNDLASKFRTASETGEMPDLRPPDGPGGMQGPPPGPPPSDDDDSSSSSTSTSSNSSTSSTGSAVAKLLDSYQNQSDPMSVLSGILSSIFSSQASSS